MSDSSDPESDPSLQNQITIMSIQLNARLDQLQQRGIVADVQLETSVALSEIRSQLRELTKSVESCQTEVHEVKRDMANIKDELHVVQQVKEEIEELREYVDRLEEVTHKRKLHLLSQVNGGHQAFGRRKPSARQEPPARRSFCMTRERFAWFVLHGLTFHLTYTILSAMLGMFQFGYNTGVINAPEKNIEKFFKDVYKERNLVDMTDEKAKIFYSVAVSIFAIGGMLGGFSGGSIADKFGR
ncbi:hypothetical protein M8J76_008573 [Diaphorina citri]|nr:hypothetical protein M8J76_008573 [Diaphorina citri]